MKRQKLVVLAIAFLAAACGDGGDPQEPEVLDSDFELEVTGALNEHVEGAAFFGEDTDESGNEVWALVLGQDTSRHVLVLGREGDVRPGVGTYEIGDLESAGEWTVLHIVSDDDELEEMFIGHAGTVEITKSTADVVEGEFEFEATGLLSPLSEIVVTGSFRALRAEAWAANLIPASVR